MDKENQDINNTVTNNDGIIPKIGSNKSEGIIPKINSNEPAKTDSIIPKTNDSFKSIAGFFKKHKKGIITGSSCTIAAIVALILFLVLRDTTVIYWDESYPDQKIETIASANQLELKAIAVKDEEKIKDITYEVSGGTFEVKDEAVIWDVPGDEGEYTIVAKAPSGKKIEKTIAVFNAENQEPSLAITSKTETDENTDSDEDGLTDYEEKEYGTSANDVDTDNDGIIDYIEIYGTKTDPTKADSDDDGMNDGNEIILGYDPLKADSLDDGTKDGDRNIEYSFNKDGIDITINGNGNIASTSVDVIDNQVFAGMEGISGKIFDFGTDGNMTSATITIPYTDEDLSQNKINESELTFYFFNSETGKLEPVDATVDTNAKTITATLTHFSMYTYGNTLAGSLSTDIMFVIDNSVSMYTEQQMIDAGYDESTGTKGSDPEFKRLELTKEMATMFNGNYRFGVAEFSGNYVEINDFTSSLDTIQSSLESMRSNWKSDADGTDIVEALDSGIDSFIGNEQAGKYVILLTDGENTEGYLPFYADDIINNANNNNVKVCIIGLGSTVDTEELTEIAEGTGCHYYSASNANALDEIYALIGANINYGLVDTDDDGEVDGMILADSGFITSRDGFNFANKGIAQTPGGVCAGMAEFAMARYIGKLPVSLGQKTIYDKYGSIYSDEDGILWISSGYDLSNTYFMGTGNLFDYKLQDESISAIYSRNKPKDYYGDPDQDNDLLKLNDKYKTPLLAMGGQLFTVNMNSPHPIYGVYHAETIRLDVESPTFVSNANSTDAQLFKALWRMFILQKDSDITKMSLEYDSGYDKMIQLLNDGIPTTIAFGYYGDSNDESAWHEVNAVRWIKDINNKDSYKLEIYDSNYPGEREYFNVQRTAVGNFLEYIQSGGWSNVIDGKDIRYTGNSYYTYDYSYNAGSLWTNKDIIVKVSVYPID